MYIYLLPIVHDIRTHTHIYIYMSSILTNHGRTLDLTTRNGRILSSKNILQYMRQFNRTRKYPSHLR